MADEERGQQLLSSALAVVTDVRTRPPATVLATLTTAATVDPVYTAQVLMTLALLVDDNEPVSRMNGRIWMAVADHHLAGRI